MAYLKTDPNYPDSQILLRAVEYLNASGVIAHATETVYGLTARWDDWAAIQKLSRVKQRPIQQPYSIMVNSILDIIEISGLDSPPLRRLLKAIFPAPITLLLSRQRTCEIDYWNQFEELGFRIPDHTISRELVKRVGSPLLTTSANLSGEPAPVSAEKISKEISENVDCILDSGDCQLKISSTVVKVDLTNRKYAIVRPGAFPGKRFNDIYKTIWE